MFLPKVYFIEDSVTLAVLRHRLAESYPIYRQYSEEVELDEDPSLYVLGRIDSPLMVLNKIRKEDKLSAIMVMADGYTDSMKLYSAGADLVFPENMNIWELYTRAKVILKRLSCYAEVIHAEQKFCFYHDIQTISYNNKFLKLNYIEFELIKILSDHFNETIDIRTEFQNHSKRGNCSYSLISINLHQLRKKLPILGLKILTVNRVGYLLCKSGDKGNTSTSIDLA